MPWACGCAGEPDLGIPVHDAAVVNRYRKIREHARRSEGQERETAKGLLKKLADTHLLLAKQVKDLDHKEAVAKANESVARAAAARAAAMSNGDSPLSATDQAAYWGGFIEETIAYIADHPNEPTPSAVAFVETLDLGQEGRVFTSIKRTAALTLARWADSKIAEQVEELRAIQRDLERGRVPTAVQQVVDRVRGKRSKKKRKSPKPPSRKRKRAMAEALLQKIEDECDCELAETEDTKTKEELWEFGLVIPKAMWADIVAHPEALVKYMNDTIVDSGGEGEDDDEDEPGDSGMGLDEDDPFPDPDNDEETNDGDEDSDP